MVQVVINEDSTSQQSYPDIRDVQDADYSPDSSDIPGDSGPSVESPKVNVSTYLNCRLDFMAGEIARAGVGAETLARVCTKLCEGLYENGKVDQRYVIPRSKLQSTLKRDGEKKIADLAKRKPEGELVDTNLSTILADGTVFINDIKFNRTTSIVAGANEIGEILTFLSKLILAKLS